MKKFLILFFIFSTTINQVHSLQCWTCDSKCGCRTPVAERCPARSKCYTLKSLSNGDIVHKGCAVDCIEANQNGKICETCDGDACNSEQSLAPMSGHDECRIPAHESRKSARSFPADIGSGTGYNGYNNNPDIGSGTGYNGGGYNPNNIGSGTGYNPNGIGSGVGYNPNSDNYPKQNSGGIGSGTVYGGNQPNGNYYPSGNVGSPYGGYGDRGAPQIGQGARPGGYNGVSTVMNLNKALGIMMSFIVVYFTL